MRLLLFLSLLFPFSLIAQNEVDALRYSQLFFGGSARYMSLAGSMNAVGGDPSCASVNPAGLARLTYTDLSGSFSFSTANTSSLFNSTTRDDYRFAFNVGNAGIVGAFPGNENSDWKMVQFGITYQRLAYFSNSFVVEGNNNSSLLDVFAGQSNGIYEANLLDELPFSGGLAYWTYAIDPDTITGTTYTTQIPGSNVRQIRNVLKKGGLSELAISLSGNYMDHLYLGATLGIPFVRYTEGFSHEEYVLDSSLALNNYQYKFDLNTRGTGINLKVGAIYLPADWLRIGVALHSPSSIGLTDTWSAEMSTSFRNGMNYMEASVPGIYNYRLKTPGRAIGSIGVIIGKLGLLSGEIEHVNYGNSILKPKLFDSGSFEPENNTIKEIYTKALNFRFGSEWRIKKFSIRGGYALYGSPYKSGQSIAKNSRQFITAGLGYRGKTGYIDVAFVRSVWQEDYYFYNPAITAPALIDQRFGNVFISVGARL